MKKAIFSFVNACVCFARKVWRPITCLSIAGAVFVNGIYIPISNGEIADMTALAALVASLTPFIAARAYELVKGRADEPL